MSTRTAQTARLTLRSHPAPQGWAIGLAVAGTGLIVASLLLRHDALSPPLGIAGVIAVLPMLWATRPGPVTVIDRAAGQILTRSALGRVLSRRQFDGIEGVACDHITLPAPTPGGAKLTIYRTLLLTGGEPVAVRGFGAPGPARDLKATIERWLAEAPAPETVH